MFYNISLNIWVSCTAVGWHGSHHSRISVEDEHWTTTKTDWIGLDWAVFYVPANTV